MAEGFDSSSAQGFLMQTVSASAGTTVTVKDAAGNELISEKIPYSFSSVLVSLPEMKIGDTCTLIVGDTETEITIDNVSNGGGFGGGFDGRQMPGRNGFGGGQMPDRDGFGRDGRAFDGGTADETQDSESVPNGSKLSTTSAAATVNLLSTAEDEGRAGNAAGNNAPPDAQNGNSSPRFPRDGEAGEMQPPERQNGTERSMVPPELQQGNMAERENALQTADAGASISPEALILLGISAVVLLFGCVIAGCYKRRGR